MGDLIHVGPTSPLPIVGSGEAAFVTNNNTSGTLYLGGPAVSSSSKTYTVAAGGGQVAFGPLWGIGSTRVHITKTYLPVGAQNLVNPGSRYWVGGIGPLKAASGGGTNTTVTANTAYLGRVHVPQRFTATGIGYLVGTTGGTHVSEATLYDYQGAPLAWSALAGATVGSANTYDTRAFTAPFDILTPGNYFLGVAYSGTTPTIQLEDGSAGTAGATSVIGGTAASAVDFSAAPVKITAPSSVGAFPIAYLY